MANANWVILLFAGLLVSSLFIIQSNDMAATHIVESSGPIQPKQLWNFSDSEFVKDKGSSAIVEDGIVYIGTYALDAYSGAKIWHYHTTSDVYSSPAVANGAVFVGADNDVLALNASTGDRIWGYPTSDQVVSSPAVVNGVVYVGSSEGNLYALNASMGIKVWNFSTGNAIYSSPQVIDNVVYFGSLDRSVYALNASSGVKIWAYPTGGQVVSSPAVKNGVVYIASMDKNLYALNASTGEKLWSFTVIHLIQYDLRVSPTIANGVVYISSLGDGLYALDSNTGGIIWNNRDFSVLSSGVTVGDGIVYVGTWAVNASTGKVIWNLYVNRNHNVFPKPAISNGVLYVTSDKGRFYAIGEPNVTPTASPSSQENSLVFGDAPSFGFYLSLWR
jgi:eukaryotic-like serine/threonine-protein kinase